MDCQVQPQKEHQWLEQLVGEWTYEADCPGGDGQMPMKMTGTESVRSLGGLWVVGEGRSEMPGGGGPATMILTIGYDPAKKKFVGSWIGSMMANLWVYEGSLDAAGKVLSLHTEGPNMMAPGSTAKYKEVIEVRSKDERTFSSHMQGPDGEWINFMKATYRRK